MSVIFQIPVFRIGIVFVSSMLYGAFLVLFVLSAIILHQQYRAAKVSGSPSTSIYLTFSYMMFAVLTTVWVLSAIMCFNPGITNVDLSVRYYNSFVFSQHIIGYLANFIGDLVMVYRLYVVWDQRRVILYIVAILGLAAVGLTLLVVVRYSRDGLVFMIPNVVLVGLSISVNVISTLLIAWRVWKRHELTRAVGGEKIIFRILAVIVESSALYTAWMLCFLAAYLANSLISQVFLYGSPHVAGVTSMLINVRVGLGWAVGREERFTNSVQGSASVVGLGHDSGSPNF